MCSASYKKAMKMMQAPRMLETTIEKASKSLNVSFLSSYRIPKFENKKKTSLTGGCEGGTETDLIKFRRPKRQFALTVVYS